MLETGAITVEGNMTTEEALNRHFAATGILHEGCTRKDWYPGNFVYLNLGLVKIPFIPILRRTGPVVLHDIHHMLKRYGTDWKGEVEIAGWELGSGGCRWHLVYWVDRLLVFALGLLSAPATALRGFRAGRGHRNLYGMKAEQVLSMDPEEVCTLIG